MELYLYFLKNIIINKKQILILVPEIKLISKIVKHFYKKINIKIDILHSKLSQKEKLNIWLKIKNNKTSLVIGTRSAIFSPFPCLGLIILDEEHDTSYKEQKGCRYHTRDLAIFRAKKENIPIIISSLTPTLETLYNVHCGKYYYLNFQLCSSNKKKNIFNKIINIKNIKNNCYLSSQLINSMKTHLNNNNQVLLFLNKRGHSSTIICDICGWISKCYICNRHYTFHYFLLQLRCHYCNKKSSVPLYCMKCGSNFLKFLGTGIEQLEKQLNVLFPGIPILRIDSDSSKENNILNKNINNYKNSYIFIGTKMILEKNCFSNITLIGLLNIDNFLLSPNFRSIEQFAHFYIKIMKYIKNYDKNNEIFIQTHYPKNNFLQTLIYEGYFKLARKILLERKIASLPPFTKHVVFFAKDINIQKVEKFLIYIRQNLEKKFIKDKFLWIMGPCPASKYKSYRDFQYVLLIQHFSRKKLYMIIKNSLIFIKNLSFKLKVKWFLDIDPIEF